MRRTTQAISLLAAICVPEATPPDCVSWGSFAGSSLLPIPGAGAPPASEMSAAATRPPD